MHFLKITSYSILLLGLIAISACNSPKGTSINGSFLNAADGPVVLEKKTLNSLKSVSNVEMKKGQFDMVFPEGIEPGLYRLKLGGRGIELALKGNEKQVKLSGDFNGIGKLDYTIAGSPLSETFLSTLKGIKDRSMQRSKLDEIRANEDPLLGAAVTLGIPPIDPSKGKQYDALATRLSESYPEASISADFKKFAEQIKQRGTGTASGGGRKYNVEVGQPAPDIALSNPDGKEMKLSDLKGKIVLLDFWASWCGPCRRANPHVVETYHKYKDQGFTVFSVSLDGLDNRRRSAIKDEAQLKSQMEREETKWLKAIEKDQLAWDTHVSALQKWQCPAAKEYGVSSIPTTFLIDRDGKIAALNPRRDLEVQLRKLL